MTALFVLAQYFTNLNLPDLVVVSPDVGRVKLNQKFADWIGADLALMTKRRPEHQVAQIGYVLGDVAGKTALIVDDIIDTAGTLSAAAQTVLQAGATRVFAAATHPVFSGKAYENLAASGFEQIVVTDTIPLREDARARFRGQRVRRAHHACGRQSRAHQPRSRTRFKTEIPACPFERSPTSPRSSPPSRPSRLRGRNRFP